MSKSTILVIDDEQSFLDIITNTLKEYDYKVIQALNGEMGIMVARKFIPDIIVCDWEMPIMNGIDAIKILKDDDLTKNIPVIMATGTMITPNNLNTALKAGAVDYVRKPIDPIELIARINSALELARSYSEVKQKNKEITEQYDHVQLLNATKDKFFKIIAHDLKAPFNTILGFTDLLRDDYNLYDDAERLNCLSKINKSSKFAYELLENLLVWAQSQIGEIKIVKEPLNLRKLVETSIGPYQLNATLKNIEISLNIPADVSLTLDRNTSITFISNIFSNAIKFTPEGGLIIIETQEKKNYFQISIIDTGVGMSPDIMNKLFRIDENITTVGTNNERGTGLGLILCKEFIEINGGKLDVKSTVGKGSQFIINLPKNSSN